MSEPPGIRGALGSRLARIGRIFRAMLPFTWGVVGALAVLLSANLFYPPAPPLTARDVGDIVAQSLAEATPAPAYSSLVYQIIQPSLVLIQTETSVADGEPSFGLGSGVIVTDRGDILTSLHVVQDAAVIRVYFADGTESSAIVAASQPENDIAVLQTARLPAQVVPATLGSPGALRVGDEAYVVGNPLGLYGSMSAGVISGFERSFQPIEDRAALTGLIQVDAAINPGSSGGPLLNRYGQVVGIVTGLVNPTEQEVFIGIGFAVPITVAGQAAGLPPY